MALDEVDGSIELQFFDGTVDEADPERWLSMRPNRVEPPEDWSGSVDIDAVDLPYIKPQFRRDWQVQLDVQDFTETQEDLD